MAKKIIKYDVAIKSTKQTWQMDVPKAYTNDLNSVEFQFTITDMTEAELSTATANVLLYMRDGSFFQNTEVSGVTIDGTVVKYTMKENEGNHSGVSETQVEIFYDDVIDKKLVSQRYQFEILNGLESEVAVEVMIQDWATLTAEARTFIDNSTAEVNYLKTELQTAINTANTSLGEFDAALETGIVAANLAEKLEDFESTNNSRLLSVESGLADTLNKSAITLTHMFADNTARDAYFVANPSELIELQFIKVGTAYQQYIEGVWTDSVPIVAEQVSATNQPIVDTGEYFVAENTNEALQELGAHKANADNPHGVTKTQVGLGNVDNTSDANKPVSTATQAALNLKGDKSVTDSNTARIIKLESNDEPMHYDKVLGEYVNVGKYWDAYRDGKIYTTEFNNYEVSPSPMGTKKDANAGLVAVPSTNLVAGQDDYANIGLFKPVEVNAYVDANDDYHITAIKGDARFKRDGTNGDVYIMNMLGYIKRFDTPTTWGYSYSDTLYAGFSVLPEAVKPDGTVRPFLLHAKYIAGVGSDGKLASISGVNPEFNSMSHDGQITKFKAKGEQYSGKTTHDDFWMKLMLFLKYATTNSEAVMRGCISYYLQYQPSIYESGVSRVVLTNAQANALVVGSRVSIGNYAGGTKTEDRNSSLVHNVANRVKITSITALPDGLNSAVNVDAPAFDTNATTTITTVPWGSGACDDVLGNDGSPISNTSGKEPLIINGIETMVGGYEVIQNLMIYNDNTNPLDYKIKVYVCYDSKLYKAGSHSADYKLLSVLMAQTNNTWQYISKLGVDPNHPTALIPVAAAASSTTGFADGIYANAPTTGYRVWLSLGYLLYGSVCGFFYVFGYYGLGYSAWYILGRLSATGRSRGELA